ncbi:MAG: hypothetical protein LQ338_003217 [Usnochroma carphineum]|nr:MAG: hypothetical protein LQ338_003217 [Usnochroma carphineum]
MKDLYTFDVDELKASSTYQKVRKAYDDFFNELRVPVLVARAYSGEIGGKLSHEYHIATTSGEDTIISCVSCKFAYNEELVPTKLKPREFERSTGDLGPYQTWFGISKDRCHLVEAILPRFLEPPEPHSPARKEAQANTCLIRSRYPELDLSIERPFNAFVEHWKGKHLSGINPGSQVLPLPHLTQIYDYRVSEDVIQSRGAGDPEDPLRRSLSTIIGSRCLRDTTSLDLARPHDGGKCPNCGEESLKLQQAVELGHTFHLGKRYSEPMKAKFVAKPTQQTKDQAVNKGGSTPPQSGQEYFHMGCHGIGISRMIAAVADALADKRGLIWPRAMAPYEAVILATEEHTTAAEGVLDMLTRREDRSDPVDAILDDRDKDFGWKLQDADLIGFPIVIILGSKFGKSGLYEVSVRRLGTCQKVAVANLRGYVTSKLAKI